VKILHLSSILKTALFGVVLLLGTIACSGTEHLSETTRTTESIELQPDRSDMEALFWARIDSSRMNFVQADIDFMTDMIAHHAQALIMSRLAPENEADRSIQVLAARIINAQHDEIGTMQKWLRDRGQPVPEVHIDGLNLMIHMEEAEDDGMDHSEMHHDHDHDAANHHDHAMDHGDDHMGMGHHHDMPGMLTQQQLEELAGLKGREFDRTFLKFMIEHHKGAIIMVDQLFSSDGAALDREAFDLASGINAEQITEIERMKLMLEQME